MQKGADTFTWTFYRMLCSGSNVRKSFLINYTNAKAENIGIIAPKANGVTGPTLPHRNYLIGLAGRIASSATIWIEAEPGGLLFCSDQRREIVVRQHSGLNPWTRSMRRWFGVDCRSAGRSERKFSLRNT